MGRVIIIICPFVLLLLLFWIGFWVKIGGNNWLVLRH
jgi:hypothetical protein